MLLTNKNRLIEMLGRALQELAQERGLGEVPQPRLERPKAVDHGDVACNIALQLSKAWKLNPRDLAQALVERLQKQPGFDQLIASCDIAGPGFINFRLSNAAKTTVVTEILSAGPQEQTVLLVLSSQIGFPLDPSAGNQTAIHLQEMTPLD